MATLPISTAYPRRSASRSASLVAVLAASAVTAFSGAARAQSVFTSLVDYNTAVPGGSGNFDAFSNPVFGGGQVIFVGGSNAGTNAGVYAVGVGATTPSLIADYTTTPSPGSTTFTSFTGGLATNGSNVVFGGTNGTIGIFSGGVGNTGAARVVDATATAPAGPSAGATLRNFTIPSLSGTDVVYRAGYVGSSNTGIFTSAIGNTNTASRVADTALAVPGGTGNFTSFGNLPTVSGGNVLFYGAGSSSAGFYVGAVGTYGAAVVVDRTYSVPDQSGLFTSFSTSSNASSGTNVAFRGNFSGGNGVYKSINPGGAFTLSRVADTSQIAPGTGGLQFNGFSTVSISGTDVAFIGGVGVGGDEGVFVQSGGTLLNLVATGDSLFGSTVSTLSLTTTSLSGNQVVFGYSLSNGVNGIGVASFVPEPSTWAALVAGTGLLGGVVLRRRTLRA